MSNIIHWGFAGTPATYTTPKEKFAVTVSKLRTAMNIHPEHEIIIHNLDALNQSISNDVASSDSVSNTTDTSTVSVRAKKTKSVEKTAELLDLPTVLDDADSESDVL